MLRRIAKVLAVAMALVAPTACVNTPSARSELVPPSSGAGLTVATGAPAVAALGQESLASLVRSPVRMYVLPTRYAAGTLVMDGERWSALSYHDDELTLSLHATNAFHDAVPDEELAEVGTPNAHVRGVEAWETVNEGIRSLAWTEGGVAYALEVECAEPEQDVRCTEGAFLSELATALVPAHEGGSR